MRASTLQNHALLLLLLLVEEHSLHGLIKYTLEVLAGLGRALDVTEGDAKKEKMR